MKTITNVLALSASVLFGSSLMAQAVGNAFKIEERCRSVQASNGIRYTAPCDFRMRSFQTDPISPVAELSLLRDFPYNDRLLVQFVCEALAPVSLQWSFGTSQGVAAPDLNRPVLDQTLASDWNVTSLQLTLQNPPGIQYFKPGCRIDVLENFKVIDLKALTLFLAQTVKLKLELEDLFRQMTSDQTTFAVIQSIDDTLSVLEFMLLLADDISAFQISTSMQSLEAARQAMSYACGAGSTAAGCTAVQAHARDVTAAEILKLQNLRQEFSVFMRAEQDRLVATAGGSPAALSLSTIAQKYLGGL